MTVPPGCLENRIVRATSLIALAIPSCAPLSNTYDAGPIDAFAGITPVTIPVPSESPTFYSQPVFEFIDGKTGSHAPTLCVLPDGTLLAAWYSYDGPGELDNAEIFSSRHHLDAAAWTTPKLLVHAKSSVGNPVLFSEDTRLRLFYAVVPAAWGSAQVAELDSPDNGDSWSNQLPLNLGLGVNVRFQPLRLDNGRLLLPAYDELLQRSLFFIEDETDGFSRRSAIFTPPPTQNLQPSVIQRTDGSLLAVFRNQGRGDLLASVSADRGATWSTPRTSGFANPNSPAQLLRLADDTLLLVFNDSQTDRHPLSACVSDDEGRTWTLPHILVDGPGQYAYPTAVATPDGLIHVVYSHNRERIQYLRFNAATLRTSASAASATAEALAIQSDDRLFSTPAIKPRP